MSKTKKKTSSRTTSKKHILNANELSFDGGIVWELSMIHIDIKGEPAVRTFGEGLKSKPNTMMRTCFMPIPAKGIQVEHLQLHTEEDLDKIRHNPDLLRILLDSLTWDEPFYLDDLNWSSSAFVTVE
ncbi:MAG TPA: hypothetical protein VF411_14335 [Bacteroidia bacterium]